MYVKTVKNNVHLHVVVGRIINKLFHGIEKYKIRSTYMKIKRRRRQFTKDKN